MTETQLRAYEALFIVPANADDASIKTMLEKHTKFIEEQGGKVGKAEKWEKRKLAYPIRGHSEGNYCLILFDAPAHVPAELTRIFRISDDIIRGRVYLREK